MNIMSETPTRRQMLKSAIGTLLTGGPGAALAASNAALAADGPPGIEAIIRRYERATAACRPAYKRCAAEDIETIAEERAICDPVERERLAAWRDLIAAMERHGIRSIVGRDEYGCDPYGDCESYALIVGDRLYVWFGELIAFDLPAAARRHPLATR